MYSSKPSFFDRSESKWQKTRTSITEIRRTQKNRCKVMEKSRSLMRKSWSALEHRTCHANWAERGELERHIALPESIWTGFWNSSLFLQDRMTEFVTPVIVLDRIERIVRFAFQEAIFEQEKWDLLFSLTSLFFLSWSGSTWGRFRCRRDRWRWLMGLPSGTVQGLHPAVSLILFVRGKRDDIAFPHSLEEVFCIIHH